MSRYERGVYLACDIDMTLQAGDWHPEDQPVANIALATLVEAIKNRRDEQSEIPFYFGTVTGRTLASQREEVEAKSPVFRRSVLEMNLLIGSVGAEMARRQGELFAPVEEWPGALSGWDRSLARRLLLSKEHTGELVLQGAMAQSDNKLSFDATLPQSEHGVYAEHIRATLQKGGVEATTIFSGGRYLDILPRMADGRPVNKGTAIQRGATLLAEDDSLAEEPQIVFAGDSENDEEGFAYAIESGGLGVVPANASQDFKHKMRTRYPKTQLYIAHTARFAMAIHEALRERGVLF